MLHVEPTFCRRCMARSLRCFFANCVNRSGCTCTAEHEWYFIVSFRTWSGLTRSDSTLFVRVSRVLPKKKWQQSVSFTLVSLVYIKLSFLRRRNQKVHFAAPFFPAFPFCLEPAQKLMATDGCVVRDQHPGYAVKDAKRGMDDASWAAASAPL